ncbi:MAG: NAD(P)-dependent glycerol-3-phosphate dehydrogenase [Gammaproteobacteria bacterium]|nr:MAG: NAD(P)-dependent glycerol-3-phosphate dehydrogenase [Gammaproteobacteria bacterium]
MSDKSPLAVLGAGSWGTALACLLARKGYPVRLWGRNKAHMENLSRERENRRYLPGIPFPPALIPTATLEEALATRRVFLMVPSQAFRPMIETIRPLVKPGSCLLWGTKGLEPGTGKLLYQVARETLGEMPMAILSGPTFAREVAMGLPTAVTLASREADLAAWAAETLHNERFRVYTSRDVIGVSLGGAVKNVLAIAAGIADGLGFGANTRAALITRGLAEMMRLGERMGGQKETFMGLAGLGDLVLTATEDLSRNRRLGLLLAEGMALPKARAAIGQAVEGVGTAREIMGLAQLHDVEMPISEQVYQVLYEGKSPQQAVDDLLHRAQKEEQV